MIDERNFFDKPVKNNKVTYNNVRKITTVQGAGNTRLFFILEEAKETVFEFSQGAVKVL